MTTGSFTSVKPLDILATPWEAKEAMEFFSVDQQYGMKGYPVTKAVPEELGICEFAPARLGAQLLGEKK